MKKQLSLLLLTLCLILAMASTTVLAASTNPQSKADNSIDYQKLYNTETTTGGLSITGINTTYLNTLKADDDGKIRISLVIPEQINGKDVMAIGYRAFLASQIDTRVYITDIDLSKAKKLKSIASMAFYNYGGSAYHELKGTLTLPNSITFIGSSAFMYHVGLTGDLILPDSIEEIQYNAFNSCGFDGAIKLPKNEKYTVASKELIHYTKIKSIKGGIPDNIKIIENYAFSSNDLTGDIVLPQGVKELGSAFKATQITSLVVPDTVTKIGGQFISDCMQLKWVKLNFDFNASITTDGSSFMNNGENNSELCVMLKDKASYDYIYAKTSSSRQKYMTYPLTLSIQGQEAATDRRVLYNRPINWQPDANGLSYSVDADFALPEIPDDKKNQNYGWSFKETGALASDIVTKTSNVTGSTLYLTEYIPLPKVTTSEDIQKTYDGQPAILTINISHPYLDSGDGQYVIGCNWRKNTIEKWQYVKVEYVNGTTSGNSVSLRKNTFALKNVADTTLQKDPNNGSFEFYEVKWYILKKGADNKYSYVNTKGFYGSEEFRVTINKATPEITPTYPEKALMGTVWSDIPLTANNSAPPGTIEWKNPTKTIALGDNNSNQWEFTPTDSSNYNSVSGDAKIIGMKENTVTAKANQEGGSVSPTIQTVMCGDKAKITITRNPGYKIDKIMVGDENRIADLEDDTFTLANVENDSEITVIFEKKQGADITTSTDALPEITEGKELTSEEKNTILDTKLDYNALPKEEQENIKTENRDKLNEALAALPEINLALNNPDGADDRKITVKNLPTLLENMTQEEAMSLKNGDIIDYKVEVSLANAAPEKEEAESIDSALKERVIFAQFDISVKKTVTTTNQTPTTSQLDMLASPIQLVFELPQSLTDVPENTNRTVVMLRTHLSAGTYSTEVLLDEDSNPSTYTLSSDAFSTYTLAYKDSKISYAISAPDRVENGKITVSPESASKNSTVSITATPNEGYELDKLSAIDGNGKDIPLTNKGNGIFVFTMADSDVTINASFIKKAIFPLPLPFSDVSKEDWFYDAVAYSYDKKLMVGTSATLFSPSLTTTRGMIMAILYRLEGEPSVTGSSFKDVSENQYYADAVTWGYHNKIVMGYGNGYFGPNDAITREQMAAILHRYTAAKGHDVSAKADIYKFNDADKISSYAVDAMAWAVAENLVCGMEKEVLDPQGNALRSQAARILMQYCKNTLK